MILSIINVNSAGEKRAEVFQTLASVAALIRGAKGCLGCEFCQETESDTAFTLIEEWCSREEFDEHLRSQVFGVLLGLTPLLKEPLGMRLCTVASLEGMDAVRCARSRGMNRYVHRSVAPHCSSNAGPLLRHQLECSALPSPSVTRLGSSTTE